MTDCYVPVLALGRSANPGFAPPGYSFHLPFFTIPLSTDATRRRRFWLLGYVLSAALQTKIMSVYAGRESDNNRRLGYIGVYFLKRNSIINKYL